MDKKQCIKHSHRFPKVISNPLHIACRHSIAIWFEPMGYIGEFPLKQSANKLMITK